MDGTNRWLLRRWPPTSPDEAWSDSAERGASAGWRVCPAWSRLFESTAFSPGATGALIAAALTASFLLLDLLDGNLATLLGGQVPWWLHVEVRSAVIVSALVAGVLITHRYEEMGTRRDLSRLLPELDDEARGACSCQRIPVRRLRLAGAVGAVSIAALVPTLYLDPTRFLHASTYLMPSVLFDFFVGAVLGWTTFKTLFAALEEDRRFAHLARHVRRIDLLDLTPLHVFGRRGLRRAVRWLLLVSVASLVFLDAGRAAPPALVLSGIFGFAWLAFLLPVWGVHQRIRGEKLSELEGVRRTIVEERARLRAAGWRSAEAGGRFADLLAYEARISAAKTWPFDASTLVRLALYGCLPLGSWLASALVERAVDRFVG
jgi:hypothetical protein